MRILTRSLVVALVVCTMGWAQQPTSAKISNGRIDTRATGGNLVREFQALVANQSEAAWAGYVVPIVAGNHNMCCTNCNNGNCCTGCTLETRADGSNGNFGVAGQSTVKLEGAKELVVLFRIRLKAVEKIRTFTEDCPIDAGGTAVTLFTGVTPAESVALLTTFVTVNDRDERNRMNSAMSAIAMHAGPEADQALDNFSSASQPEAVRDKATLWMGNARGQRGYLALKRMSETDPSDTVRYSVTFALSQSREPGAIETLIAMAKNDKATRVRSQALFWLGQKAGQKAVAAISDSITNDPDTQVKEQAVFALSRLPKDDGVPKLIQVARSNGNAAVRKKAMFWLGQSKDPRAVAFFEEVLAK